MKVSYNWLKQYISTDLPISELADVLTDIGLEVEGQEEYVSIKGGLDGVVIGEVLECEKHPNSDHLSLTKVSIGAADDLQIVCGAPNVAKGQKVVVALVGTTIYPIDGGELTLAKRKVRGEYSFGMICAEDELGLGRSHDGITVLPADAVVGTPAADYFGIEKDTIFEIGLTPNRSDATSHVGVAKDLAAALKINFEHSGEVNLPSVDAFKVDNTNHTIPVTVENTAACPRYSGVTITGLTIKESPDWLKTRLNAIGVRPINNIVDITNFVLHELGQPLHAFDLDEIKGKSIIVKNLADGTVFHSLDEVERKLHSEDLMICDGESNPMCIGGVFGGIKSGVKDSTTSIFLESAHFAPGTIRRTSTRHLLRTDAARCFEKTTDPNITVYALKRAILLIQELAGGTISSEIVDIYPNPVKRAEVKIHYKQINRLIGTTITIEEVKAILAAMDIQILLENRNGLTVSIPTDKADVKREADVIEEILRIYGFNKVPIPAVIKSTISFAQKPDPHKVKNSIADYLANNGMHEMMALSLTQSKYFKEMLPIDNEQLVYVNNTSNQHLDIMRPTMLIGGLEALLYNQNRQRSDLKYFEFGRSYQKQGTDYTEHNHLALFLTGKRQGESWLNKEKSDVSYYTLKGVVQNILTRLGFGRYQVSELKDNEQFAFGMKYHRGKQVLVNFGKVSDSICSKMGIKEAVFYAEFDWDTILGALKNHKVQFTELSKYPSMRRDLAIVIDKSVNFKEVVDLARRSEKKILQDVNLFDVYENAEKLGADKKSYAVSFTFRDANKTLKDKDVNKVMQKIQKNYEQKLKASIR